ncbi:MAG: hypothetical protein NVS1B13_09180 [Flavisolibacter sp.]
MKRIHIALLTLFFSLPILSWNRATKDFIAQGKQPEITIDSKGTIRSVFGRNDSIFCSTSLDKGESFSVPTLVGHLPKMHLGMSRGPQLASSLHYSVDHFYAVWLDLRLQRKNNICFSSLSSKEWKWKKNKLIYRSPEGHTCECCKPNIAVLDNHVAVMFRNWLKGSRDLYLTESTNGGETFASPEKLGSGTWKLNGCPMDGGGVTIDEHHQVLTTWQREGVVYYCKPREKETSVGKGRICSITAGKGKIICCYQNANEIRMKDMINGEDQTIAKGSFVKSMVLPTSILFVWEQDQQIQFKKL